MELKTSINQNNSYLKRLFPFLLTNFSQYVRGISTTNFFFIDIQTSLKKFLYINFYYLILFDLYYI